VNTFYQFDGPDDGNVDGRRVVVPDLFVVRPRISRADIIDRRDTYSRFPAHQCHEDRRQSVARRTDQGGRRCECSSRHRKRSLSSSWLASSCRFYLLVLCYISCLSCRRISRSKNVLFIICLFCFALKPRSDRIAFVFFLFSGLRPTVLLASAAYETTVPAAVGDVAWLLPAFGSCLFTGPIYKTSYDLSRRYLKFIVRST